MRIDAKNLSLAAVAVAFVGTVTGCSLTDLSTADVYKKSIEATNNLTSLTVDMKMKADVAESAKSLKSNTDFRMDVILKPDKEFFSKVNMSAGGKTIQLEEYFTKDGMIVGDPKTKQWKRVPSDKVDQMMKSMNQDQTNPSNQLEKLKPYVDQMTMTKDDQTYVISVKTKGDQMKDFLMDQLKNNGNSQLGNELSSLNLSIHQLDYVFTIDKKTFYPQKVDVTMDYDMDIKGTKEHVQQTINGVYSNYNQVPKIVLPEAAKSATGLQ